MRLLLDRAEILARAAQKRRLDKLAQEWREHGARATTDAGSVTIEAEGLSRKRLAELRFVGVSR